MFGDILLIKEKKEKGNMLNLRAHLIRVLIIILKEIEVKENERIYK